MNLMALKRFGRQLKKNTSSKRPLQYERFEERKLLAGDLCLSANSSFVLEELASQEDTAGLQSGLNQLVEVASESDSNGTTSVFQQIWNGLPVHDAFVTVSQDSDGNITNVRDQARQGISGHALDTDPISVQAATRIGAQDLGNSSTTDSEVSLAWYFTGNRARLSYLVETAVLDASGEVAEEFDTWVNIFNGTVFHREADGSSVADLLADPITETGVFPRIVINDAIGAAGSRDFASPFDAVVSVSVGCTGSLISPNTVITARHCGVGAGDSVRFGDNSSNPDGVFSVAAASQPGGGNAGSPLLDGGDVTILTLTTNVPASIATPLRFVDATDDLVGLTAVTVGYGFNGLGSVGHGNSADGFRWGGENVIDVFGSPAGSTGSNIISTDFDNGSNAANTIGSSSSTPLEFEATTAPGDSGGPILVDVDGEWVIAGVLSGGTTANSVFGDISWWTGTSIYRTQIEASGGVFIGNAAGSVEFSNDSFFAGDPVALRVLDGNVTGDVTVTLTSESGDSEVLTIAESAVPGSYVTSINTAQASPTAGDGILQVTSGELIEVTYSDVDDGDGNTVERSATAEIVEVAPAALIGIDFDSTSNNPPPNWLGLIGGQLEVNDLTNENGGASRVDLAIDGTTAGFPFPLDPTTVPQYTSDLTNVDGQVFTNAQSVQFTYSDLNPLQDYYLYVLSADGFFPSIEQLVTIQGDGNAISFEQRFNRDELFINNQVGDSSRDFTDYALVVTADSNGEIAIDIDPILNTADVALSGLAIFEVPQPAAAPAIILNDTTVDRSIVNEVVVSFDDIVTLGTDSFELVRRGDDGGTVNVTPTVDNSTGVSVVTLAFDAGAFVTDSGSLVDGNYQLTVFGDQITTDNGVAIDGDGDGVAGGNLVFGDTETDNFFRFFGDADGNRIVNSPDLLEFRRTWLANDADSNFNAGFDSNADGVINVVDLLAFRNNFLDTVPFV